MSCAECDRAQDNPEGVYYVRVDGANVGLLACRTHAAETIRRLVVYSREHSQPERIGDLPEPEA